MASVHEFTSSRAHEFKAYPQHNRVGSALKGYLVWVRVRPDYAMPVQGRTLADTLRKAADLVEQEGIGNELA